MFYRVSKYLRRVRCRDGCGAIVAFGSGRTVALCPKCGWEHWKEPSAAELRERAAHMAETERVRAERQFDAGRDWTEEDSRRAGARLDGTAGAAGSRVPLGGDKGLGKRR